MNTDYELRDPELRKLYDQLHYPQLREPYYRAAAILEGLKDVREAALKPLPSPLRPVVIDWHVSAWGTLAETAIGKTREFLEFVAGKRPDDPSLIPHIEAAKTELETRLDRELFEGLDAIKKHSPTLLNKTETVDETLTRETVDETLTRQTVNKTLTRVTTALEESPILQDRLSRFESGLGNWRTTGILALAGIAVVGAAVLASSSSAGAKVPTAAPGQLSPGSSATPKAVDVATRLANRNDPTVYTGVNV